VARIRWVDEDDASGPLAEIYEQIRQSNPIGLIPDILKTMSSRPDFLGGIYQASDLHFNDGALSRAQHEMIAAYVSAINRCHY
jgi:hypothetical protein